MVMLLPLVLSFTELLNKYLIFPHFHNLKRITQATVQCARDCPRLKDVQFLSHRIVLLLSPLVYTDLVIVPLMLNKGSEGRSEIHAMPTT